MKIAVHNWLRPEPLDVSIERLARLGYDGLEITSKPATTDIPRVKKLLADNGVESPGALAFMAGGLDLFSDEPFVRAGSLDYLKRTIDLVAELGGYFVTVPCTVGKVVPTASEEDEWRWYVEGLRTAQEHATAAGVRLAVEPLNRFETYLINRADQALRLAEEVGPDCGVVLDIFHMNIEERSWRQAIELCRDRLVHFHVADNTRGACGDGEFDWNAIVGALRAIGYDGYLSVEFMPPIDRTPLAASPIDDPEGQGLEASMVRWLRDHSSGVFRETEYTAWLTRSLRTLRTAIATTAGDRR
ncbi:sugar phosphate isomerase/epimerase family protein [Streptomyces shenzhenensis]|uniref:sugar phosphate isomerase/epimerase family protein n=1 Tax=Streptomyces shenzhenensis TaxID=943815 RepID=UPI0036781A0A